MATSTVQINYLSRDYASIRQDLINYLKVFFPDQWQDFNVASPGMALVELNAYVGDLLSYIADKKFNEMFLDGISERKSAYRMAKTHGYRVPGVRPAITIAYITAEVPPTADGPDPNYTPVVRPGMQIKGAGQVFETVNAIDFSQDFSENGVANRIVEPILNANQDIIKYRITKQELVKAGATKIYKKEIIGTAAQPFYELMLPENNVLEILNIIVYDTLGITTTPTFLQFNPRFDDPNNNRFYEVDYLATNKIFTADENTTRNGDFYVGKYVNVERRFEKEFMADGSCKITFGGGTADYDAYTSFLTNLTGERCAPTDLNISHILNNTALGVKIAPNSTIFVKYRIGGGSLSNVGSNVLTEVGNIDAQVNGGTVAATIQQVISSIRASNPVPAIGGVGLPTVTEIRNYIAANYAAQDRCVTLEDYISRCYQMPGKFGSPFKVHGTVEDNKVKLYVLTRNASGKLISSSTSEIKNNLLNFLVPYRMINDYVEINDAKVVNLQIEADLFVDKNYNLNEVKSNAITLIQNFMNVEKWEMNQTIYISQIIDSLREVPGIINVVDIRFFNMESGGYSDTVHFQATGQRTLLYTGGYRTRIEFIDNSVFGSPISLWEIKNPSVDIAIRVA